MSASRRSSSGQNLPHSEVDSTSATSHHAASTEDFTPCREDRPTKIKHPCLRPEVIAFVGFLHSHHICPKKLMTIIFIPLLYTGFAHELTQNCSPHDVNMPCYSGQQVRRFLLTPKHSQPSESMPWCHTGYDSPKQPPSAIIPGCRIIAVHTGKQGNI